VTAAAALEADPLEGCELSLVRGGPLFRLQSALGLGPDQGRREVAIRLLAIVSIAWLPVALGAVVSGRAWSGSSEPLFQHFGVHARCLAAIPLFVLAEGVADRVLPHLLRYFVDSGVVPERTLPAYRAVLRDFTRLRDSRWGYALVLGIMVFSASTSLLADKSHEEVSWALVGTGDRQGIGFAGLWYLLVSRPLFAGLGALWLWRLVVVTRLMRRISNLDLRLVAAHPDRAAGLSFLDPLLSLFTPVVLGASIVVASRLAHEVLYHDFHVPSLQPLIAVWLVLMLLVFAQPLVPFALRLARMRRESRLRYGAFLGRHGELLEARWLSGRRDDEGLLGAGEIGTSADAFALYESVDRLRPFPLGLRTLVPLAAAALLPFLPVVAIEVPIRDLLLKLVSALA
jgi:hypothetical protein